jgi:hypothetical protein
LVSNLNGRVKINSTLASAHPEIRQRERPQTNPSLQILNQIQGGRKGMGVSFGQNPKGMKTNLLLLKCGAQGRGKGLVKITLNYHLSLTEEDNKHLLAFKEMVWTLRRIGAYYQQKQARFGFSCLRVSTIRSDILIRTIIIIIKPTCGNYLTCYIASLLKAFHYHFFPPSLYYDFINHSFSTKQESP